MDNLAQIFSLLDTDQKDYITESDLRTASNLQNNGNIDDIIKLLNIKNILVGTSIPKAYYFI